MRWVIMFILIFFVYFSFYFIYPRTKRERTSFVLGFMVSVIIQYLFF